MYHFSFYPDKKLSKLQQISKSIIVDIEKGILTKDTCLPSINAFSAQYDVARDTIERAYRNLKDQGYITSVAGKGYFVKEAKERSLKILLIVDKLSSFKKSFYECFIFALGDRAKVDLQVHHYNDIFLTEIIEKNLDLFDYYFVMPHFFPRTKKYDYSKIFKTIPPSQLVLLDNRLSDLNENTTVIYQDLREDIYEALNSVNESLCKYDRIVLIIQEDGIHASEIVEGAQEYCSDQNKKFSISFNGGNEKLKKGTVYIIAEENDLADIIKKIRRSDLKPGEEIGIISFNESVLKELLDITTFSADFEQMADCVADIILNRKRVQVNIPFKMIRRNSI